MGGGRRKEEEGRAVTIGCFEAYWRSSAVGEAVLGAVSYDAGESGAVDVAEGLAGPET